MPKNARNAFLSDFSKITGTGNFHSSGTAPFFLPGIQVNGEGELALPLPKAQAKALVSLAEAAPYGKGKKTVLDEGVRKCWQIDARLLSFKSPQWKLFLAATLSRVREDLGIAGKISAIPYKLLIYEPGGHFRAHRDTEKLDAMFGTLILALPSAHEGAKLFIRHEGREIEVDFSREEHRHEFQYAAFFADCEHEVEPVRSGWRCCLVYNLRLEDGDAAALNQPLDKQAESLLPALKALARQRAGRLSAVLLEHSYTEANCSWRNLKGNDRARARALLTAAREAGLAAHLGLVTFHQMGELKGGGYGYHDADREEGAMGEIYEEGLAISQWRDGLDRPAALGEYQVDADALISKGKFGAGEPDEKQGEGYTGNAGCTMEYWYRRAAIVFWAEEDHETILCEHDFPAACRMLASLAAKKDAGAGSPFYRLASAVIGRYPGALPHESRFTRERRQGGYFLDNFEKASGGQEDPFVLTLRALAKSGSRELAETLIGRVPSAAFGLCDAPVWPHLFKAFGVDAFVSVFEALMAEGLEENRGTLFRILSALLRVKKNSPWPETLAGRLASLAPKPPQPSWEPRRDPAAPGDPGEARILLLAAHLLKDGERRRGALAFLQADASLPYIRNVLGPALLDPAVKKALSIKEAFIPEILEFAKEKLAAEVACALEPYPDWTRPCPIPENPKPEKMWGYPAPAAGSPELMRELAAFMADPAAESRDFVRRQGEREMIEHCIRNHFLDLDHITIQRGRPYILRCTKNDDSYRHALKIRAMDRELLRKLEHAF